MDISNDQKLFLDMHIKQKPFYKRKDIFVQLLKNITTRNVWVKKKRTEYRVAYNSYKKKCSYQSYLKTKKSPLKKRKLTKKRHSKQTTPFLKKNMLLFSEDFQSQALKEKFIHKAYYSE